MFGQVREDAAVDIFLLEQITDPQRLFVVASGGCTALSLLSAAGCQIDALDISQAQTAMVELKVAVFKELGFDAGRQACIADAGHAYENVRACLSAPAAAILDRHREAMESGLNNAGWVDQRMHKLTELFYLFVHSRKTTWKFLSLLDVSKQSEFYRQEWRNWQWRAAMAMAFNRNFLALVHGKAAMQLVPPDFSEVMERRLERALTRFPNAANPYLWQAFFAKYPDGESGLPPYLQGQRSSTLIGNLPNLKIICDDALPWLAKQSAGSFDYFGLSNIPELLPPTYADALLPELIRCARSGALVCVRSIFPRHSRKTFNDDSGALLFDRELTDAAEDRDRSLFCNFYEVYRRV